MTTVTMVIGCPASGKSSRAKELATDAVVLNRDSIGGKISKLVPLMSVALNAQKNVVLDNTFPDAESRRPFIEAAHRLGAQVNCEWVSTSIEDAQINALFRMYDLVGNICLSKDDCNEAKHPNIFPPAALFRYRKVFQKPDTSEGFSNITKVKFSRRKNPQFTDKAIIFDYDGTLRHVPDSAKNKYPIDPSEVVIMPGRQRSIFQQYEQDGYHLLGVSNQSGVGKGILTQRQARRCFEATNLQLGVKIDYRFCPHSVPPVSCYCRKPQAGLGVCLIKEYNLDPSQVIMVGDMTSDRTFARRLGFEYVDAEAFFENKVSGSI